MKIVEQIFEKVESTGSKIIVVTKYFNAEDTLEILKKVETKKSFLALGENRIEQICEKNLPREKVHFIGNLQSKQLKQIAQKVSVIHSLCNIKHAKILNEIMLSHARQNDNMMGVFFQINISREPQKLGILPENFGSFLKETKQCTNLEILGISAIGAGEFTVEKKRREFLLLKEIRDEFLPGKKISAGTSRDFEIALEEGIEIVRIGKACF